MERSLCSTVRVQRYIERADCEKQASVNQENQFEASLDLPETTKRFLGLAMHVPFTDMYIQVSKQTSRQEDMFTGKCARVKQVKVAKVTVQIFPNYKKGVGTQLDISYEKIGHGNRINDSRGIELTSI